MSQLLSGARIFVAGGGISVGRACVELFLEHGAQVAFLDIDPARVEAVTAATGALGFTVDIADKAAVEQAVNTAAEQLGGLSALINIASHMEGGRVVDLTEEQLQRMVDVNIKGYYWTTQAAIPHMLAGGRGSIVQFGSVAATHPGFAESYSAVKAAQVALAYQLAMEHAPVIRSNAVLCGWITDSHKSRILQSVPELIDPIMADHPMGRGATADELARVCLFLASDLSAAVNGETLVADGGQTRTQGNLNQMFQSMGKVFAEQPELVQRMLKMQAAATPEELMQY